MKKVYYRVLQALFIRLLYLAYALGCIWRATYVSDNKYYWLMMVGIGFLLIETGILIWLREGREFKGFLPSVLFFLSSVLPSIWILQIDEAFRRTKFHLLNEKKETKIKDYFDEMDNLTKYNITNANYTNVYSDFKINYWFHDDIWENIFSQSLLLLLVLSRWLTTRSKLNINQRFLILIISVAIAADILDFTSYFNIDLVYRNKSLLFTGLFIFSLSLLQFIFLYVEDNSLGVKSNSVDDGFIEINNPYEDKGPSFLRNYSSLGPPRYDRIFKQDQSSQDKNCFSSIFKFSSSNQYKHDPLFLTLLTGLFLHDGSYLTFRIYLLSKLGLNEMLNYDLSFLFFLTKNVLVILTQLYKVYKFTNKNRRKRMIDNYRNLIKNTNQNYQTTNPYRFAQIYANIGNNSSTLTKAPFVHSASTLRNSSFYEQFNNQHSNNFPQALFTPKTLKNSQKKTNSLSRQRVNSVSESVLAIMANDYQTRKQQSFNSHVTTQNQANQFSTRVGKAFYGLPFLAKSKTRVLNRDIEGQTSNVFGNNKFLKSSKI